MLSLAGKETEVRAGLRHATSEWYKRMQDLGVDSHAVAASLWKPELPATGGEACAGVYTALTRNAVRFPCEVHACVPRRS